MFYSELHNLAAALRGSSTTELRTGALVAVASFLALLYLDITHLLSMVAGAAGYLLLQAFPKLWRKQASGKLAPPSLSLRGSAAVGSRQGQTARWRHEARLVAASGATLTKPRNSTAGAGPSPHKAAAVARTAQLSPQAALPAEVRKPSAMPVRAPVFTAAGWEAEVEELLSRITPSPEGEAAVASIARAVQRIIRPALPNAQVVGLASGNPFGGTAFGVAVPEVDIVVNVSPTGSQEKQDNTWASGRCSAGGGFAKADNRKLQKSAIRACTDRLVASGAFKFRRSAFRGDEPKVTLIALPPSTSAAGAQPVTSEQSPTQRSGGMPINISVNAVTPLHCAALLTECGQMDPRAKSLILLVRRWAKDRGLSHAAKGHLSPYCWTLLTIFYLQVGLEEAEGGPVLPALKGFTASAALAAGRTVGPAAAMAISFAAAAPVPTRCGKQVGELFIGFIRFYAQRFDWRKEAVSVRSGRRGPPEVSLPLHIVLHEDDSTTEVGPSIEDPFNLGCNLGACTNAMSLARLRDELARAHEMCSRGALLSELLEPWAPPEAEAAMAEKDE